MGEIIFNVILEFVGATFSLPSKVETIVVKAIIVIVIVICVAFICVAGWIAYGIMWP